VSDDSSNVSSPEASGMDVVTFRYVLHDDVECYLHAGWVIAADLSDCYHGGFGVLMLRPTTLDGRRANQ
jgi:hypothetical protein